MDTFNTVMSGCRIAVISVGLIGNLLSYIIFSRPAFQKNSISTYCRALAIFECFTIYELVADIGLLSSNYFYAMYTPIGCKLYYYIGMAFGSIPGWILIAFSIDKVLIMKKKANFIKKRKFQYMVIFGIVLFNFLFYIEIPIYLTNIELDIMNTTYYICDTTTLSIGSVITMMFLIDGSLLPFLIMFASSIIMIKTIRDSSKTIKNRHQSIGMTNRTRRDIKFAITSIAFNVSFVLFKMPLVIMVVLSTYYNFDTNAYTITFLLYFVNYSISFLLHLASNSIFRREFLIMFRIRKSNSVLSLGNSTLITNRNTTHKDH